MDISGPLGKRTRPAGPSATNRGRLVGLLALLLVTTVAITALARWGPGGSTYVGGLGADLTVEEWTEAAFEALTTRSCDDAEGIGQRLLHPELAAAIDRAWGLADFISTECGNSVDVVALVEPPDLAEHFDDELAFLAGADALWQVALDSQGDDLRTWMVVEIDGQRWLFSLLLHFYARCATGDEAC